MSEIKEFLNDHDAGELPCEHIKIKLENKIKAIDEQIQQFLILRHELSGLVSGWETIPENPEKTICPIIERN